MFLVRAFIAAATVSFAAAADVPTPPRTNQTNLPPPGPELFNASTRVAISAPIDTVWAAVLDFPSYPSWNPFVRSAVLTDDAFIPLPASEQTVAENIRAVFQVQIPPLPLPVSASTPSDPLHAQISFENITHLEPDLYRVAWKQIALPDAVLSAERWSAVSVIAVGPDANKTLYESREAYSGALAPELQVLYEQGLQEAFDAQAVALKGLLEGQ
ncbi:hypothetical protein OE88DRAFT_1659940 [Heliocybe sulcata]|uniref:Coenzyme Q-binding protein COQ10 START domain-containing protein n=1 Tax=Heliocybe sulcata TaxID=5364 RepID=A0A5C3N401_9AGAM|nr:hypothetical protein OE88DRAFT_1659940 [Heliocybe sulcata]